MTLETPVALLTAADLETLDYQPGLGRQTATVRDLNGYCNPLIPFMRTLSSTEVEEVPQ